MLTNEQGLFLDAEGKIVLCACPGSGKTFIVGKKVLKYLESWAYEYRGVAVLSFTNVASKEILKQVNEPSKSNFSNLGFPHYIGTLGDLIQKSIINITRNRKLTDIIKIKSRIKIGKFYSTDFLDLPIFKFFEKKTTKEIIYSSVHGVKGETFDASLLIVDSVRGNTVTPSLLTKGDLNNELMRIAYVAMTRPRKLLVVSMPKQKSSAELNRFPYELWDYKTL